ncbi:hypothetical protein Ae406Ps2_6493 [Pseudonocardia sp. Ae406_Ps2]|nr:hypothetical protein Ae406Ps2_6493 [Pseudonocardia sp. Ae406_Ps2]
MNILRQISEGLDLIEVGQQIADGHLRGELFTDQPVGEGAGIGIGIDGHDSITAVLSQAQAEQAGHRGLPDAALHRADDDRVRPFQTGVTDTPGQVGVSLLRRGGAWVPLPAAEPERRSPPAAGRRALPRPQRVEPRRPQVPGQQPSGDRLRTFPG